MAAKKAKSPSSVAPSHKREIDDGTSRITRTIPVLDSTIPTKRPARMRRFNPKKPKLEKAIELQHVAEKVRNSPCLTEEVELMSAFGSAILKRIRISHQGLLLPLYCKLEEILGQYQVEITLLKSVFQLKTGYFYSGEPLDVLRQDRLPPAMLSQLAAVATSGDDNCFYNAVSLSLFGTEKLSSLLRVLVLNEIIQDRDNVSKWLIANGFIATEYANLVMSTLQTHGRECWATERHIWICSKILSRPIYIYSKFISSEMVTDVQVLKRMFLRTRADLRHCNYTFNVKPRCIEPVRIFLTPVGSGIVDDHFVALLKRNQSTIEFIPKVMVSRNYRDWNGLS